MGERWGRRPEHHAEGEDGGAEQSQSEGSRVHAPGIVVPCQRKVPDQAQDDRGAAKPGRGAPPDHRRETRIHPSHSGSPVLSFESSPGGRKKKKTCPAPTRSPSCSSPPRTATASPSPPGSSAARPRCGASALRA